ncbi:MAG: hypothetical protein PHC51_10225 [bacterium]|nr:hypothetical protein [bacterium]
MLEVTIDGGTNIGPLGDIKTMGDLVEFIKATIDPDKMIVSLSLDGKNLSENDWRMPISVHPNSRLQVETGDKSVYLADRLVLAPDYLEVIISEFAEVAELFNQGKNFQANDIFSRAIDDLNAFMGWYTSLFALDASLEAAELDNISHRIEALTKICEQLIQQMLHYFWSNVSKSLTEQLIPSLRELASYSEKLALAFKAN